MRAQNFILNNTEDVSGIGSSMIGGGGVNDSTQESMGNEASFLGKKSKFGLGTSQLDPLGPL